MTVEDAVIEELAASEADAREVIRQLTHLVADQAYENALLRTLWEREYVSRVHGDRTIARLYDILHRQRAA